MTDQSTYDPGTIIRVPGSLTAAFDQDTGQIVSWTFTPRASNAGYLGPAALVDEGDSDLDVESVDGPFWQAVQSHLGGDPVIEVQWEE